MGDVQHRAEWVTGAFWNGTRCVPYDGEWFGMADYRRCYIPGGSFFFTVVTERRAPILGNDLSRDLLRAAFRACRQRWPFRVDALVMLRDHLRAIWTLPSGDTDYSKR